MLRGKNAKKIDSVKGPGRRRRSIAKPATKRFDFIPLSVNPLRKVKSNAMPILKTTDIHVIRKT